jgi:hypothetical protein
LTFLEVSIIIMLRIVQHQHNSTDIRATLAQPPSPMRAFYPAFSITYVTVSLQGSKCMASKKSGQPLRQFEGQSSGPHRSRIFVDGKAEDAAQHILPRDSGIQSLAQSLHNNHTHTSLSLPARFASPDTFTHAVVTLLQEKKKNRIQ